MAIIKKASFPARENSLSFYCPLCGTRSMDAEGAVTACDHLLLVHLSIADPAVMYARDDLAVEIDEDRSWDDYEDALKLCEKVGHILILEECTGAPAPAEIQVAFEYTDEE